MISVQGLCKSYGPLKAVDNVTFEVADGEIVGFLGPNGAGKSTTIRVITCYHPADSGVVTVMGYDVFSQSLEVRRNIGYLPESTPLYQEMRVREYLEFRGKLHGMDRAARQEAVKRVTDRCWLGEFIDRPIGQLSKGMRQRVGLADALMHDPKVLVLDEPTIGLDPTQIRETRQLIRDLGKRHTILFSSHILSEVEQVCSRTIIIKAGKIVASGSPQELRERLTAGSRLIAEVKGPAAEVRGAVSGIRGVSGVDVQTADGWNRLAISANGQSDIREEVFKVVTAKGWSLREMRREVASLEDFFVKITAEQRGENAETLKR